MRLLLDTHIVVWTALDPGALTQAERHLMSAAEMPLFVSAVTIWELRLKWHRFNPAGRRKGPIGPGSILAVALAAGWTLLPLSARHAAADLQVPIAHTDPFDELLLVQAQEEGLRLLTRDGKLTGHPLAATGR